MKDFDAVRVIREEADRQFRIGGHTFTYKPAVAPEVMMEWMRAVTGEATLDEQGWLNLFDSTTLAILEPGQEETWAKVRDRGVPHPMNLADLREVLAWLIEESTGRPTGEPPGSSNGSATAEMKSKDESSSTEVPSLA